MSTWEAKANEAIKEGYVVRNQWERMLEKHLKKFFPDLVRELANDLPAYLIVQTYDAMSMANRLEDEGTDPHTARELALADLLPTPPEDQDRPEPWELEGAIATMEAAAERVLERWRPDS
jgi:hypothetical protein